MKIMFRRTKMDEIKPKDSKKIIWITLLSFFVIVIITGGIIFYNKVENTKSADKYYAEAEMYYKNGEYQKAVDSYGKIDPKLGYKDVAEKSQSAKSLATPAITANGISISIGDFNKKNQYVEHYYENSNQTVDSISLRTNIINDCVEDLLVADYAAKNNVNVTEEELNNRMNQSISEAGGQDTFEEVLSTMYEIDVQFFRTLLEKQLLRDKVLAKMGSETVLKNYIADATSKGNITINVEK